jgi:hypothetical protein
MPAFAQIPSSASDRQMWGRCLRGYEGAYGTGNAYLDPHCEEVGLDGHLNFTSPIEEWELREIWKTYGLSTEPNSAWHTIPNYKSFKVDMLGYKFRRGLFKKDAWLGFLRFFLLPAENGPSGMVSVDLGYLASTNLLALFALFDRWNEGKYPLSKDMDEAIRRAP